MTFGPSVGGVVKRPSSGPRGGPKQIVANAVGLGVAGGAGVVLLLVIASLHGPEALGRFNLLFATYLVGSQVATLGLQVSVVRYVAPLPDGTARTAAFRGAVLAVLASGGFAAVLIALLRDAIAGLLGRPDLASGLLVVAVGVLPFSVNKVLLAALTAAGLLRVHGTLVASRGVLILLATAMLILAGSTGEDLVLALVLAEGTLTLLLALATQGAFSARAPVAAIVIWARRHLRFGILGTGSTLLTELNVRIDVLVLALFVDDRAVGVYTLAATLAEAALQFPLVLRTVLGPDVVRVIEQRDREALRREVRAIRKRLWAFMAVVAGGMLLLHPTLVSLLGADENFRGGRTALAVLLIGVVVASGYVPFSLALAHGGRPLAQTGLVAALAAMNLVGNFLLVPRFGLLGAALATASANVVSIPLLQVMVRNRLGLRL